MQILNKIKYKNLLTLFIINVRSPCCWSSSSGVGGNGRFGGPPPLTGPCDGGVDVAESSGNAPNPDLY